MRTIAFSYRDHTDPFGGGAVHGYHVVEQLRRLGYRLATAEPRTDARLVRIPRTPAGIRSLLDQADAIYARLQARPWDMTLLALNRATRKLPVVLEVNAIAEERLAYGTDIVARAETRWRRLLYRRMAGMADAVVCVSTALAEHVRKTHPVPPDRVFVVPNGGTPRSEPRVQRADGTFRVVWAGGARWPWQALDLVLDAFHLLRARVPQAELVLFVDAAPARFQNEPGVVVNAQVSHRELSDELAKADAALCLYRPMPHSPAGFYNSPLKLFDYMAAGLPVIGSRLGQIAEVIQDGECGFLVGDDPREVAERLERLARDPSLRMAMGAASLARLRASYTWRHTGDRIGEVLSVLGVGP